jgi:hypothetical protein
MMMEYHYHPFGDNHLGAQRVVSPLPEAFDSEKRLDYDTREDENPVYIAFAEYLFTSETASITPSTSADTWIIQKLTYDNDSRLTRIQVARGTWDDRASLFS